MLNITLKKIAEIAGVSVSTVSKSLNDSNEIGKETKNRIKEIAQVYNYKPNVIALSLKNSRTKTIGVVIPDILNYFFVKALHGIEEAGREKGYKIITCISNESAEIEAENIEMLGNGSVDGLILSLTVQTQKQADYSHISSVINSNTPVVLFDRVTDEIMCDKIISDNYQGAFNATEYFIEKGCKNIALFSINNDLNVVKERSLGYLNALKKHGLYNENLILNLDDIEDEEQIKNFLKNNKTDAIFSVDELLAVKTIKIANQLHIKIPEKLKVIGFADGELSKEYYPSLTTVDLHAEKIGANAVNRIIERIEKEKDTKAFSSFEVQSTLIHRESTL